MHTRARSENQQLEEVLTSFDQALALHQAGNLKDAEPLYRLITTILDHKLAPAQELAALYHERGKSRIVWMN